MKRILSLLSLLFFFLVSGAENRFPKPDFESGYQYPNLRYANPNEPVWVIIDVVLLVLLMSIVTWVALKKLTRKPIIWVSIISVAYFGFYRSGCVCSIGSMQNVALALTDQNYILPVTVLLFFMLPLLFAFLFGRVFCAGVCPFGAMQDLVNIKNYRLSASVAAVLKVIPWIYLIFGLLYAVTRSTFIICRFDPFVGIFRMGGDLVLIVFGILLLVTSIFIGRPFCRFLCPYGALLSLFSRVSVFKIKITRQTCINCELCHNACPVDAIYPPYDNKVKEERLHGVKRLMVYFVFLPLMIMSVSVLMRFASTELSKANKKVKLYEMLIQQETSPSDRIPVELESFYGMGGQKENLKQTVDKIQADFKFYSTIAGALIGLVIGLTLIRLSLKRSRPLYEIDHADCVACGRCFNYCPQNLQNKPVSNIKQ